MSPRARTILAALLLLAAGARLRWFSGLQVGDDIVYSKIAADRAAGLLKFTNVHEARNGFLLPITAAYALFGPGEVPLVLYNLLCSLGLVAVLFFLARRFWGETAGGIAGLTAALHPNLLFFATECHTDTPVAFWQALAVLVYLSAPDAKRLALAGFLVGWAWLHKEHAIFLLPLFAGHAIARRAWRPLLPLALAALGVFLAELLFFAVATGDPFKRFALVKSMHVGHYIATRYADTGELLYRLFLELPRLLFAPRRGEYAWAFNLLGLGLGATAVARNAPGARLLAGWWTSIYLSYCFWPSSLRPFLPSFYLFEWTLPLLAGPLACFCGEGLARRPRWAAAAVMSVAAVAAVLTAGVQHARGARFSAGGKEAHAWIERESPGRVVTDDKTIEVLDFLDGHRPRRTYVPFQETKDVAGSVVIVDKFWTQPGQWWTRPGVEPQPSWTKLYESDRLAIYRP
ncbi:MAG TPA: glycosyltransferase family 39 protein [Planctomycetota bacterium]